MSRPTVAEATDDRRATSSHTYAGDQVRHFARIIRRGLPVEPLGHPVRAEFFAQAQNTRVEFSATQSPRVLEMGETR